MCVIMRVSLFMTSVIMMNVIMMSVITMSVIMMSVIMTSVIIMSVIMMGGIVMSVITMGVIMTIVVAPLIQLKLNLSAEKMLKNQRLYSRKKNRLKLDFVKVMQNLSPTLPYALVPRQSAL
jgi:hypothetical protein